MKKSENKIPNVLHQGRSKGKNVDELFLYYALDGCDDKHLDLISQDDDTMVLKYELKLAMVIVDTITFEVNRLIDVCRD